MVDMTSMTLLQPDNRGRLALNSVVDRDRTYSVTRDERGVVTLTPVAAVFSDEQIQDLRNDPEGFVTLLTRADSFIEGAGEAVSIDEFFALTD